MKYQINVLLSEEEYIKFNEFYTFKSFYGKKTGRIIMLLPTIFTLVIIGTVYVIVGINMFSHIFCLFFLIDLIVQFFRRDKFKKKIVQKSIKSLKKQGKLPYMSESVLEFYDDKIIEISKESRTELLYSAIERVSVLKDGTIYLHQNSAQAYPIPNSVFISEINYNEFLEFIKSKCRVIDYFVK